MADHEGRFESVEGVAEQLLVDVQTVRRWIKSGRLKAYRPGREYRILSSDLEEFLKTRAVDPKEGEVDPKDPAPSRAPDSEDEAAAQRIRGIGHIVSHYRRRWDEELGGEARYPAGRGAEVYFAVLGLGEIATAEVKKNPRGGERAEAARTAALDAISDLLAFGRQVRSGMDKPTQDEGSAEAEEHRRHLRVLEGGIRDSA